MIDVTKLQTFATNLPKIIKALPQQLDDFGRMRDAIMKMASPATAAFMTKVAGKSTPFGVHAAIFGGGFVLGAVTTAFVTPMKGDELRGLVKGEAMRRWANLTGKAEDVAAEAEDVVEEASVNLRQDAGTVAARAAQKANAAERRAKRVIDDSAERLSDTVEAAAEATRGAVVTMPAEPLDELTKEELYERAKAAEIDGRSQMDKDELIDALRKTLN